jgi:hypothetical protein
MVGGSVPGRAAGVVGEIADLIEAEMSPIELPPAWNLRAFSWEDVVGGPAPAECGQLDMISAPGRR